MSLEDKNDLGSRLKQLRNKLKISQTEMANKMGTSQHTISNYEKSKRFPDSRFLLQLRDLCQVNLNWLINGQGPMFAKYDMKKSEELAYLSERLQALLKDMS